MAKGIDRRIVFDLQHNAVDFVTSLPSNRLAEVIEVLNDTPTITNVPSNKEDEGMGLCAGPYPCHFVSRETKTPNLKDRPKLGSQI